MEIISELAKINLTEWITSAFLILFSIIAMVSIIGKFSEIIGKPVKWVTRKNEDHMLLLKTIQELSELWKRQEEDRKQSICHDNMIRDDLKNLTDMFVSKEINDYRWEIINFAAKVAEGKHCGKDSYQHCIHTYEKYEQLLEENGLKNGEIEISMEIINKSYQEKLKNGF